jgi:hypothetical protein
LVYGARISPTWYTVHREFYKKIKKDANFATGSRRAQVNDWNGAVEAWSRAAQSRNAKVAGRAAFNLALAYEVLGDLDNAKSPPLCRHPGPTSVGSPKACPAVAEVI